MRKVHVKHARRASGHMMPLHLLYVLTYALILVEIQGPSACDRARSLARGQLRAHRTRCCISCIEGWDIF